jgi:hypothetical protein
VWEPVPGFNQHAMMGIRAPSPVALLLSFCLADDPLYSGTDSAWEVVRTAMKLQCPACIMIGAILLGCARPEDSSFAAQAARRGDDCNAIAAGSAMDAYGHHVGPATEIYKNVYQSCLAWQQREAESLNATKQR